MNILKRIEWLEQRPKHKKVDNSAWTVPTDDKREIIVKGRHWEYVK